MWKEVLVERELRRGGSRRKQQEATEVDVWKKVKVGRELQRGIVRGGGDRKRKERSGTQF